MNPRHRLQHWFGAPLFAAVAAITGCASPPGTMDGARATATPPAAARASTTAPAALVLVNPGFESDKPGAASKIEGWYMFQHAGPDSYRFELDSAGSHGGGRSMRIENVGPEPYGSIAQLLPGAAFAGKTIRFSGWLKARDLSGDGAALFIIAERDGATNAHDVMAGSEIKGTRDWQRYSVTLAIPPFTDRLRVGTTLQGAGTVWFDDADLEIVAAR